MWVSILQLPKQRLHTLWSCSATGLLLHSLWSCSAAGLLLHRLMSILRLILSRCAHNMDSKPFFSHFSAKCLNMHLNSSVWVLMPPPLSPRPNPYLLTLPESILQDNEEWRVLDLLNSLLKETRISSNVSCKIF
jgi:hypothetical protein